MNIADIADNLLPDVPGAPLPLIEREVRKAIRAWAKRTRSYIVQATVAAAANGTLDMTASLGADQYLYAVNWVSPVVNGGHLDPSTVHRNTRAGLDATDTGDSVNFTRSGNVITPYPLPAEGVEFQVSMCVLPTLTATTITDSFGERYLDELENMALSRLFAIPDKSWSSGPQAEYRKRAAEEAMDEAEADVASGGGNRVPRTVAYGGY